MRVKVTIQRPEGLPVEHIAEVGREGDLLNIVGVAMEAYRKAQHDIPLFDYSTIKIQRC